MSSPHRFQRPRVSSRGHHVTERDVALLDALRVHRYMRADHAYALLGSQLSVRTVQRVLRRLWERRYVDRRYLSFVAIGGRPIPRRALRPIYALTRCGANALARCRSIDGPIPHGFRTKGAGPSALEHHLIITDFMVALVIACRGRTDLHLDRVEHEHLIWPRTREIGFEEREGGIVVPDAAFTLCSADGTRKSFYLEIVRSGVKGGNRTGLRRKLRRYAELNGWRFFSRVYRHDYLHAVLFSTTTPRRADGFRAHAESLEVGRDLFWFGSYQTKDRTQDETIFTPANILTLPWQAAGDKTFSLLSVMNNKPYD